MRLRHVLGAILGCCLALCSASAQKSVALPDAQTAPTGEFLQAADEVLAEMSRILSLPIRQPLKRSVRTRDEIRHYLIRNLHENRDSAKMHADVRAMEMLGLLPKGYPLEQKLIDLLTKQIEGVYDSKGREFFIAASTEPTQQRIVMAHELTHALEDQSFHVEQWAKGEKGNDDAQLARDAVLEGSAMVAMISYLMRDAAPNLRDLGNFDPTLLMGDVDNSPDLAGVPMVLRDQLMFPYVAGSTFSAKALAANGGWPGLKTIFERPPASTQQILHPDLYLRGVLPEKIELPRMNEVVPRGWKKLDENVMGEFGFNQILKQFLGKSPADTLAASWVGDRYATYEESPEGRAMLVVRLRLSSEADASAFVGGYGELLQKKYPNSTFSIREAGTRFVDAPGGGAFVRCVGRDCLIGEGLTRAQFDALARAMKWPAVGSFAAAPSSVAGLLPQFAFAR